MSLTQKEQDKLKRQMNLPVDRGETWVGIRPVIFGNKKRNNKETRRENKRICKEWRD